MGKEKKKKTEKKQDLHNCLVQDMELQCREIVKEKEKGMTLQRYKPMLGQLQAKWCRGWPILGPFGSILIVVIIEELYDYKHGYLGMRIGSDRF